MLGLITSKNRPRPPSGPARLNYASEFAAEQVMNLALPEPDIGTAQLAFRDASGYGNDCIMNPGDIASSVVRPEYFGNGAHHVMTNIQNLNVPSVSADSSLFFDANSDYFTACCWVHDLDSAGSAFRTWNVENDSGYPISGQGGTTDLTYYQYDGSTLRDVSIGSALHDNKTHFHTIVSTPATLYLYVDGRIVDETTASLNDSGASAQNWAIGNRGAGNRPLLDAQIWGCVVWRRALGGSEISALYRNWWSQYEQHVARVYFIPAGAGGTTYDRTVSESLSFADTDNRTATFARDVAEALAFSDTVSRDPTFNRLVSETLSYTDDVTGIAGTARNVSETLDFADTVNAQITYARLVSETLSFTDAVTRTAVYARAISESLEFLDTVSSSGGAEIEAATKGGGSMTLAQMRRMERQQLLASIREDDEVIVTLISDLLKRNKRLQ